MDDHVATDVDGRVHPGFGPDLISEEEIVNIANTSEIAGDEMRTGAWDGQEMSSRGGGE